MESDRFRDMSDLIRAKEKELRDIHDLRCSQLEKMVEERDSMILEAAKNFEAIKEDFHYNLKLLEGRDEDISKLEKDLSLRNAEIEGLESQVRTLTSKLDSLDHKYQMTLERSETDKTQNKKLLSELRDSIESIRWTADEDAKVKAKEMKKIQDDLTRAYKDKEEALETQRKELTHAFDAMLKERDFLYTQKELEIGSQISLLENKLETILNENSRLRTQGDLQRHKIDGLSVELSTKQEELQSSRWRFEDDLRAKSEELVKTIKNLQEKEADLRYAQEVIFSKDREIEKLHKEYQSLENQSNFAAGKWEDHRHYLTQQISSLEQQLQESKDFFRKSTQDIQNLREEMDVESSLTLSLKSQIVLYESRCQALDLENKRLKDDKELQRQAFEGQIYKLHQEIQNLQQERQEIQKDSQKQNEDMRNQMEREHRSALQHLEESHQSELQTLHLQLSSQKQLIDKEWQNQMELHHVELEVRIGSMQSEIDSLRQQLQDKDKQYQDLHQEYQALLLRFDAKYHHQNQNQNQNQYLNQQQLQHLGSTYATGMGMEDRRSSTKVTTNSSHSSHSSPLTTQSQIQPNNPYESSKKKGEEYPLSPVFSEDFGPVSIPNSPYTSFQSPYHPSSGHPFYSPRSGGRTPPLSTNVSSSVPSHSFPISLAAKEEEDTLSSSIPTLQQLEIVNEGVDGRWSQDMPEYGHQHGSYPPSNPNRAMDRRYGHREQELLEENEKLKTVIREMRNDLEDLRPSTLTPEAFPSHSTSPNNPVFPAFQSTAPLSLNRATTTTATASTTTGTTATLPMHESNTESRVHLLEKRLSQTLEEISRLRKERSRLMELGNELKTIADREYLKSSSAELSTRNQQTSPNGVSSTNDGKNNQNIPSSSASFPLPPPPPSSSTIATSTATTTAPTPSSVTAVSSTSSSLLTTTPTPSTTTTPSVSSTFHPPLAPRSLPSSNSHRETTSQAAARSKLMVLGSRRGGVGSTTALTSAPLRSHSMPPTMGRKVLNYAEAQKWEEQQQQQQLLHPLQPSASGSHLSSQVPPHWSTSSTTPGQLSRYELQDQNRVNHAM